MTLGKQFKPWGTLLSIHHVGPLMEKIGRIYTPEENNLFHRFQVLGVGPKVKEACGLDIKVGDFIVAHEQTGLRMGDIRVIDVRDGYGVLSEETEDGK